MKSGNSWNYAVSIIAVFALFASLPTTGAEIRVWTSVSGEQLEASFVEMRGDRVILLADGDREMEIPMSLLSREDQIYTRQQGSAGRRGMPSAERPGNRTEVSSSLQELFGNSLVDSRGRRVSTDALAGREKIGIYFSAQWCPPCRAFTPSLVDAYNELQEEGKPFEIVFVSSDRTPQDMRTYMRDYNMNFLAVRHGRKEAEELSNRFGVRGIPRLVIIDSSGNVLSENARNDVANSGRAAYDNW